MKAPARGFTLIEMMVAVTLMAIMLQLALPSLSMARQRQREQQLRAALVEIREALDAYKRAVDEGRIDAPAGSSGYPASLAVLTEGVPLKRDGARARLVLLRRIPPDPMNTEMAAQSDPAQTWGLRSYASPADAPRAGEDVFDVYSTSLRTGLNGVPYQQW